MLQFFSAVLDQIFLILAGNDDTHKSLDDFDIRPELAALERLKIDVATFSRMLFI